MKNKMAAWQQLLAFVLSIFVLLTCISIPVFAAEDYDQESLAKEAIDIMKGEKVSTFGDLKASVLNCDFSSVLDTSSFFNAVYSLDGTAFGQLSYEIPTTVESTALLNVEYISLLTTMRNAGWGIETTLEIPDLNTGYAGSITDRFTEIYGDTSDRLELNTSMPEGWTMSEIMEQSTAMRNEMSSNIKDTEVYQSVLTNISTGNTFVSAGLMLEVPELKSAAQLNTILSENSSSLDAEWDQKKADGIAEIQKESANNNAFAEYSSKQDLQDLFDKACGETKTWIETATDEALSNETTVTKAELLQQSMKTITDKMNAKMMEQFLGSETKKDADEVFEQVDAIDDMVIAGAAGMSQPDSPGGMLGQAGADFFNQWIFG